MTSSTRSRLLSSNQMSQAKVQSEVALAQENQTAQPMGAESHSSHVGMIRRSLLAMGAGA